MSQLKDKPPKGYTVQFRVPNATVRSGLDPVSRNKVDPDTGFMLTESGQPEPSEISEIRCTKSRGYIQNFLDHEGYETVKVTDQQQEVKQTVGSDALLKLMQWWLIRNVK